MQYIITGGGFTNKGAEAMTLITIDRIHRKDPNAIIYITGSVKACDIEACSLKKFTISHGQIVSSWLCWSQWNPDA